MAGVEVTHRNDSISVTPESDDIGETHRYAEQDISAICWKSMDAAGRYYASVTIRRQRSVLKGKEGKLHIHQGYTDLIVTGGDGFVDVEGEAIPVRTGDRIVIPPGCPHHLRARKGDVMIVDGVYISRAGDTSS
jgi:mannose-6-phosphate isomerase-like protein (cupin superfamily)